MATMLRGGAVATIVATARGRSAAGRAVSPGSRPTGRSPPGVHKLLMVGYPTAQTTKGSGARAPTWRPPGCRVEMTARGQALLPDACLFVFSEFCCPAGTAGSYK